MNKKLLLVDVISFAIGAVLLVMVKLLNTLLGNSIITNVIITTITVVASIMSMAFLYLNRQNKIGIVNIVVSVALIILFYVVYVLPCFDFIGLKGIQNSVCLMFLFMFGSKYALYISFLIKRKTNVEKPKTINSLNSRGYIKIYKIIGVFGIIFFCAGIFGAIFNAFNPAIDMSVLYRMLFLHEAM